MGPILTLWSTPPMDTLAHLSFMNLDKYSTQWASWFSQVLGMSCWLSARTKVLPVVDSRILHWTIWYGVQSYSVALISNYWGGLYKRLLHLFPLLHCGRLCYVVSIGHYPLIVNMNWVQNHGTFSLSSRTCMLTRKKNITPLSHCTFNKYSVSWKIWWKIWGISRNTWVDNTGMKLMKMKLKDEERRKGKEEKRRRRKGKKK